MKLCHFGHHRNSGFAVDKSNSLKYHDLIIINKV